MFEFACQTAVVFAVWWLVLLLWAVLMLHSLRCEDAGLEARGLMWDEWDTILAAADWIRSELEV